MITDDDGSKNRLGSSFPAFGEPTSQAERVQNTGSRDIRRASKKFVLIVPDGAADLHRLDGLSPLAAAQIEFMDRVAREGVCGLMQTLYDDLPKGSIVAQLGMLGWDPHLYSPQGRASCELLALDGIHLNSRDLAFRANFVRMEGRKLISYNADYIRTEEAAQLAARIQERSRDRFPGFELYHGSDFRNTLVIRNAMVDPLLFSCPEPHDNEGNEIDIRHLVSGSDSASAAVAEMVNQYLTCVEEILATESANMLFPWSASGPLVLPPFSQQTGFSGCTGIVGSMAFLKGIAKAGGIDFFHIGDGSPSTDYRAKGEKVIELLREEYSFVFCHINSPDEAAHMGDRELKIQCLEMIDHHIVRPVFEYFQDHAEELGGVMIVPDHYTNHSFHGREQTRNEAHSIHPVPFAVWNGRDRDEAQQLSEDAVLVGRYGGSPVSHLDLLQILGVAASARPVRAQLP